jgi:nucleoside-diphosphate-sugar epimerase
VTAEYAVENNDVVAAYLASKTLAERAAWSFMTTEKPSFDITVLNPYVIMGPMVHAVHKAEDIPSTNVFPVWNFLNGTYTTIEGLKFPAWWFVSLTSSPLLMNYLLTMSVQVDVRDVARAHILSMTKPGASNKRIILSGGLLTPQLVLNAIHKNFPELKGRIFGGNAEKIMPDGVELTSWDTKRSFEVFGEKWQYRELEVTVTDAVRQFLALEKGWTV